MNKKTITNKKMKTIETKNKIYKSADYLFRLHGIDNVSVDSIVGMAGVSKGSFYVHYESKNALVATIISDVVDKLDLDYKTYLESFSDDTPISDILIKLVEKIADILSNTIGYDLMKKVYESLITKSTEPDTVLGYGRDLYKLFNSVIRKGVESGEFREDLDIELVTNHLVLALRGITFEWCVRYPDFDYKDQAVEHFEIILKGVKQSL